MSAGAAQLLHYGRTAERSNSGRVVDRVYKVRTTDKSDDETVALTASGLPAIGSDHPSWSGAKCSSLKSAPWGEDNQTLWKVTAHYNTPSQSNIEESPTAQADVVSIKTVPYTVPATTQIIDGKTIENSAGDAYDPPWPIQASHIQILIQRNLSSWSTSIAQTYIDTTNLYSMTIGGITGAINTFKMNGIEATKKWAPDGSRYWEVHYDVEYRSETHVLKLLESGLRQLVTIDGNTEKVNITDGQGKDVRKAVNLNAAGQELASGADPVYKDWYVYNILNWSSMGLPASA